MARVLRLYAAPTASADAAVTYLFTRPETMVAVLWDVGVVGQTGDSRYTAELSINSTMQAFTNDPLNTLSVVAVDIDLSVSDRRHVQYLHTPIGWKFAASDRLYLHFNMTASNIASSVCRASITLQ